jgi:hypothetical protein
MTTRQGCCRIPRAHRTARSNALRGRSTTSENILALIASCTTTKTRPRSRSNARTLDDARVR